MHYDPVAPLPKRTTRILLAVIAAISMLWVSHAHARVKNSTSLSGLPAPLVAKVQELQRECGAKVTSTFRHNAHKPNGRKSEHAMWRAADLQGNPACMYPRLKGWKGGVSTDYHSVRCATTDRRGVKRIIRCPHLHLSWGGKEMGLRFAHRAPSIGRQNRVAYAQAVATKD